MLTQEIAKDIYNTYAEIQRAKELLEKVEGFLTEPPEHNHKPFPDIDSRLKYGLQLGIPTGYSSTSLISNVSPFLAKQIILAHLANKEAELTKLNIAARIMLEEVCQTAQ